MKYKFSYRRHFFWHTIEVSGHTVMTKYVRNDQAQRLLIGKDANNEPVFESEYDKDQDKMVLYSPNGGIREIKEWSKCEVRLGQDWVLATKSAMESKLGVAIPFNPEAVDK